MRRKAFVALYVLVILAMVLSACARATPTPTPKPAAQPTAEPTEAPKPTPTPMPTAEEFKCDDPLGCVEIAPGDPIRIAYMLVVSGPNESLGVDSKRGVEIAIDDVGGELVGHPVELVGADSQCSPEGGQTAAQKIAADKSIVGVIGTNCSSAAKNAAPIISQAGMVMISPSNTAPYLTDPKTHSPGYFRTAHNDKVQGRVAAEFAYNVLGTRKAATIHDGSIYAEQLANVFAQVFKELGGEVVAQEAVNVGDTDMRPVLTTIAAAKPEIIYYPIFIAEGALITRQAKEVSGLENVILMGADGMFSPDFVEAAGDAAKGMYLTSPDFTAFAGGYKEFLQKHEEKYGEKPLSAFHAHAYDATMLIFEGIKKVAVKAPDGTLYIPRQALRDAIAGIQNFQGLTGNLTCDPNGDCADPHIAVYQITNPGEWNPDDPNKSPVKVYPKAAAPAGINPLEVLASAQPKKVESYTCDDPLGCVEVPSGDPVRIAYMLVVSGPNESLGVDSKRGIEIAIDDVGGELLGHPVELVGEDSQCSPEGGQTAAQKIAADKSIVGVIGTNCSSAAKNAAPIISQAGMVMISPSNTAPYLTDPKTHSPGYFRTAHNDKVQGRVAAEFAYNVLGARKAATIHDGSIYAEQLANVFAQVFKELGGEVVAQEAVNVGDTDMRPVLTTIAAAKPEIIYYPIFIAEGALITRQAKEVSGLENVILMGADGMFSPDFMEAAGDAAVGAYLTSPDFTAFAGGYKEFLQKHEEKYGEKPLSAFHAHAYDGTMLLFYGIAQVAVEDANGTLYIPRQALRDAIAGIQNFQGLTGNLTCDPNGDCADPHIAVYQITNPGEWNPDDPDKSPVKVYPKQ